ncbi:Imidazolonepropionase [Caloramator mitchellensis]|uniref:Imidazolonepropionase n=1 Tax=Caloramator mitchellensis TaxID=908809 RepID=A0A0R3K209_CALMK|nr:imidazolonepropionase [Caloramator mitchellensis]KRQ87566.1 Imidazolonepropionase [Caloramator mitchellensis]
MKNKLLIKNASEVVTCSGFEAKKGQNMNELNIIEDGAVVVEDGIIKLVGKTQEVLRNIDEKEYEVIDAKGKAILPGFIDSHTHFVFGGYRADEYYLRLKGATYMEIMQKGGGIINSVRGTRQASKEELVELGLKRLNSMLSFGVTTVEGKSGYGLDFDTEVKQLEVYEELNKIHPVDIVKTYLGAHSVPTEYKGRGMDYIEYIIKEVLPYIKEKNLAEFVDVFCEKNVFSIEESRRLLLAAKQMGFKLKMHADEIVSLGGAELAAEVGATSADHLLQASDEGIKSMAEKGVIATLLPATAFSLREHYARARHMIDSGASVALASDFNPGSCFTENLAFVVALSTLYMNMTLEEAITAITINAAAAIGREKEIGSLDQGKQADIVILEHPSYKFIPYHIGISSVEKVIKRGKLVFDKERDDRYAY